MDRLLRLSLPSLSLRPTPSLQVVPFLRSAASFQPARHQSTSRQAQALKNVQTLRDVEALSPRSPYGSRNPFSPTSNSPVFRSLPALPTAHATPSLPPQTLPSSSLDSPSTKTRSSNDWETLSRPTSPIRHLIRAGRGK
ncbi:hypothetical protein BT69DRAFT_696744 [Atractiella rhizophila]|nr:hypothetical protein BT69DRAFT_696744 [Atractiella rhizophila]